MSKEGRHHANEILRQVEADTPFNTAAAYAHTFASAEQLHFFGGDCRRQSLDVRHAITVAGIAPQTLRTQNDKGDQHFATIANIDDELLYLDPNIFLQEVLPVSDLLARPGLGRAVPTFYSRPRGYLFAHAPDDQSFSIAKTASDPPLFSYHLDRDLIEPPSRQKALEDSRKTRFEFFRILAVFSRSDVVQLRFHIKNRALSASATKKRLGMFTPNVEFLIAKLAEKLALSPKELLEILDESAKVHTAIHGITQPQTI